MFAPVFVPGVTDAVEVKRNCARRRAGSIVCWDSELKAVPIPNSEGTLSLAVGESRRDGYEVCAVTAKHTVACSFWLGDAFRPLDDFADVVWVSEPIWDYRCAVLTNGHAVCIGAVGGLARGERRYELPGVSDAVAAFPYAEDIACAVNRAGAMKCFGKGMEGAKDQPLLAANQLYAQMCLRHGGDIECYGSGRMAVDDRQDPVWSRRDIGGVATDLACDTSTCCAVVGGAAKCWGDNQLGQLGDGIDTEHIRPTKVAGLPPIASIQAGDQYTLALARTGDVYLWGDRRADGDRPRKIGTATGLVSWSGGAAVVDGAQILNVTGGDKLSPMTPLPGAAVSFAEIGDNRCAALADGSVRCIDWNTKKWLLVRELRGVAALDQSCAVLKSGAVRCFRGDKDRVHHPISIRGITKARRTWNRLVELTDGSFVRADVDDNDKWSVVKLPPLSEMTSIGRSAGGGTCAIQAGHVVCWLDSDTHSPSLLGRDPAALGDVTAPAPLSPDVEATAVSVGNEHACAIDPAGAVWCWGHDRGGEIGAGHASHRDTPTRVVGIGN